MVGRIASSADAEVTFISSPAVNYLEIRCRQLWGVGPKFKSERTIYSRDSYVWKVKAVLPDGFEVANEVSSLNNDEQEARIWVAETALAYLARRAAETVGDTMNSSGATRDIFKPANNGSNWRKRAESDSSAPAGTDSKRRRMDGVDVSVADVAVRERDSHVAACEPAIRLQTDRSRTVRTMVSTESFNGCRVEITTTNHAKACDTWVDTYARTADGGLLGLDLEWRPSFTKGVSHKVALLQLSTRSHCLVLQLLHLDAPPLKLFALLADADYCFGGVGINGDTKKLREDHGIPSNGEVELCTLAIRRLGDASLKGVGLKHLARRVLDWDMPKNRKLTMSNWAVRDLNQRQVHYAAQDAWASHAILDRLMRMRS